MNAFRCTILASIMIAAAPAAADIAMTEAITIAESTVTDRTLVQIRLRDEDVLVWRASFVDAELANVREVDIDAATGDVVGQGFDAIDPADLPVYEAIFADPDAVAITFVEAVSVAQEAAGAKESPFDGQIDIEAGILAFQIEFLPSESKFYVDAATGVIANENGDDAGDDDILTAESLLAGIDAAIAANGLPVLSAKGEDEQGGDDNAATVVEVLQWDAKSGQLVQVMVDVATGQVVSEVAFVPSGNQLARLQPVIDALASVTVTYGAAMAEALAAHPGALGVHEVSLKVEDAGVFYEVELVNALGLEIEVLVSATTGGTAQSTAGFNYHVSDYNLDRVVDAFDLTELLAVWGTTNPLYDQDGDMQVTGVELSALLAGWN